MSVSALVGFNKTRVTTTPEHVLGTVYVSGSDVYIYAQSASSVANLETFALTEAYATTEGSTQANKTGETVPSGSYFWATETDFSD